MRTGLGVGLTDFGSRGGVFDIADGGAVSAAALFLAANGPNGVVLDFPDASIAIDDAANLLDFNSRGQVFEGALVGPGARIAQSAPSAKLTIQDDGLLRFQAHNLYLNSEAPANQSVTVIAGASYAITITGSVSMVASGAATGAWTAGTTNFTAATGTLTLGSTTGSGTVHLRRTPSRPDYIRTTGAAAFDLPYEWPSGARRLHRLEPAATNLALNSNNFSAAYWTKAGLTVAQNADGLLGASSAWTLTATTGTHWVLANGTGAAVRMSVYAKAGTVNWIALGDGSSPAGHGAFFNLSNGTVGSVAGRFSAAQIEALGNGWFRCSATSSAANFYAVSMHTANAQGLSWAAAGTETVLISQVQVETGSIATSPIITYAASVTRAADTMTSLLNLFPSIGTAYTIYALYQPASASAVTDAFRLDDTTTNELVTIGNDASGAGLLTVVDGGVSQASLTSGTINSTAFHRLAASIEGNNVRLSVNGGTVVQDTSVTLPTLTRLLLGTGSGLAQLAIFTGARTDGQLQAMGA